MKKLRVILLGAILTSISAVSFGSKSDCIRAGLDVKSNYQDAIKYCKPYERNSANIANILGGAYYFAHNYKLSEKYFQRYVQYSKTHKVNNLLLSGAYGSLANIYYLGQGVKKNIAAGISYLKKSALLGNAITQIQLSGI